MSTLPSGFAARLLAADGQVIDDATLAEIEAQFSDGGDGVWIAPAFARAHGISAADERQMEKAVASTEAVDMRVLMVDLSYQDERFAGNYTQLVTWIQDDLGGDAVYVAWREHDASIELHGLEFGNDDYYVDRLAAKDAPGDPAGQVERAGELLDAGNAYSIWSGLSDKEKYSSPDGSDAAPDAGLVTGLVVAAIAVVAALSWWGKRATARRSAVGPRNRTTKDQEVFALPTTVLRTVRAAEDRSLRRQADDEIRALGRVLVAQDLDALAEGTLSVWEQAMEHHVVAGRVLEVGDTPADVVGALVLARRGEHARQAALAGETSWVPQPGCWFNPLHDGPTTAVQWRDDAGPSAARHVDLPACAACARAVRQGKEPADVLDFVQGDKVVHYYRLDIGPWSRTGYGSLETDLISALRTRRGRRGRWLRTRRRT